MYHNVSVTKQRTATPTGSPDDPLEMTHPTINEIHDPAQPLDFHGGLFGTFAPFVLFLTGVMALGLLGAPDERGFWPVLVAAIGLGLTLARDRTAYSEAIVRGMSQPIVALMIMAWLLAGVLASLMQAGGVVDALVAVARTAGVGGGTYAVLAFLIGCAVSTATGTSLGTILLCAPLLYPAGAALGTNPAPLMGAILAGATFGDNVSPVSRYHHCLGRHPKSRHGCGGPQPPSLRPTGSAGCDGVLCADRPCYEHHTERDRCRSPRPSRVAGPA